MKVVEKSEDRLVFVDGQSDKKLAIGIMCAGLLVIAFLAVSAGAWLMALVPLIAIAGLGFYLKRSLISSVITFDRTTDRVTLVVNRDQGQEEWNWALGDVETAELGEAPGRDETPGDGLKRPVLVLKDGTRVPLRPYKSAGGQSFDAVARIQMFLGQEVTGAPVGWIPFHD